jgi:hypothetical protein
LESSKIGPHEIGVARARYLGWDAKLGAHVGLSLSGGKAIELGNSSQGLGDRVAEGFAPLGQVSIIQHEANIVFHNTYRLPGPIAVRIDCPKDAD